MKISKLVLFFFFYFVPFMLFSQGENNIWHISKKCIIDFNTSPPQVTIDNNILYAVTQNSVCDPKGNLLLSTMGYFIWNGILENMPNGIALQVTSGFRFNDILPFPSDTSKYYVFTLEDITALGDLRYNVVDMMLQNNKGDVIAGQKNILISSNNCDMSTTALGICEEFWLITHERNTNTFRAYNVSEKGVSSSPVETSVGSSLVFVNNVDGRSGKLIMTPDNTKFIMLTKENNLLELYDFDQETGIVSNFIKFDINTNSKAVCFSPNNQFLYVVERENVSMVAGDSLAIYQYDISSNNEVVINASRTFISYIKSNHYGCDMQYGPDGIIYIGRIKANYLAAITTPNMKGVSCTYVNDYLYLANIELKHEYLPKITVIPDRIPHFNLPNDTLLCVNNNWDIDISQTRTQFLWNNGSTLPKFQIQQAGTYWVEGSQGECSNRDTLVVRYSNEDKLLPNDTLVCDGIKLPVSIPPDPMFNYQWQDGTNALYKELDAGTYWIEATNANCSYRDTINVQIENLPLSLLPNDTSLCSNTPYVINLSIDINYEWQDGTNDANYTINSSGIYSVLASKNGCSIQDTISVQYLEDNQILPRDTTLCPDDSLIINLDLQYSSYLWNNGSMNANRVLDTKGVYWVEVDNGRCTQRDSIDLGYVKKVDFNFEEDEICNDEEILIEFNENNANYLWQDGSILNTYLIDKPETVYLQITQMGCTQSDSLVVNQASNCPEENQIKLFIPNVFSPSSNNENARFRIGCNYTFTTYELSIMDRWGNRVFFTKDQNKAWDGSGFQSGVYLYYLYYEIDNEIGISSGDLTLVR